MGEIGCKAKGIARSARPSESPLLRFARHFPATLAFAIALTVAAGCSGDDPIPGSHPVAPAHSSLPEQTAVFYSNPFTIDQIYRSMMGPLDFEIIRIRGRENPELVWVTGYQTEIVDAGTQEPLSVEFMCHNNLDVVDLDRHADLMNIDLLGRAFTLSQGQMGVSFPTGFGIPFLSNERLRLGTQVLNLNAPDRTLEVKYKTTIHYVRDMDVSAEEPMKALGQQSVQGLVLVEGSGGHWGVPEGSAEEHGESCAVGIPAMDKLIRDPLGRKFAAHWVVAPGVEENHTQVTSMITIDQDTRIHHISVHLHPFAESLELRDLTTDETVFKAYARNTADRVGLEAVDSYSSAEGLPIFKDHEYGLISIYANESGEPQDAMAVMLLYVHDKGFRNPGASAGI
jgi:hypothetical protein